MMSELTKQIDDFALELCAVDRSERSKADQYIIELTRFARALSQKIDKLEDAVEPLGVS